MAVLGASYLYGAARLRRRTASRFRIDDPPAPGSAEFDRLVESISGSPVRSGNRVTILHNGCQVFPAMLEAVAAARSTVDFSSYIYWPGEVTESFTAAFIERAAAGIEVRLIVDGWGSAKLDRGHVMRLREAGVQVAFYRPPRWHTVDQLNQRMHRRLLVVDGRVGFAGGVGIADVWHGDAEDPEHWRETHARLEGPAVADITAGFLENWSECVGEILSGVHLDAPAGFDDGLAVQVSRSAPKTSGTVAAATFYAAIVGARRRLWLTTAYFGAGPHLTTALADAAARGVDVRLLLNGPNIDKPPVRMAAQRTYAQLLAAGVRIFEYQRTMLHAKVLIVDDWANIGSSNFDYRSFALDMELNLSVNDPGLVTELEQQFLEDLDDAQQVDPVAWSDRGRGARIREWTADLLRQSF